MSYSKLFGSILDSTIWQTPTDTRIVWIAMLAMKDQDGVVEASIPGLAKRAGVSLEAAEEALATLLAPDPYSRTKDHEGRRIVEVDGGWAVLNHDKYRDKENAIERREKGAKRAAKHRRKVALHSVTRNAPSREVTPAVTSDTETDVPESTRRDPGGGSPSGPELPDPDRGARRDHVQPPPGPGRADPRVSAGRVPPAPPLPASPPDSELRRMLWPIEQRIDRARQALAREFGLPPPLHEHPSETDSLDAMARLRESGAEPMRYFDHVLEVAVEEARDSNSLKYLGWCLFRSKAWGAKVRGSPADARGKSKSTGSTLAKEVLAELQAEERDRGDA